MAAQHSERHDAHEPPSTDPQDTVTAHKSVQQMAHLLMLRKNFDYGDSWRLMRTTSFVDRMKTRLARIDQLLTLEQAGRKATCADGILAELLDIQNEAIFAYITEWTRQHPRVWLPYAGGAIEHTLGRAAASNPRNTPPTTPPATPPARSAPLVPTLAIGEGEPVDGVMTLSQNLHWTQVPPELRHANYVGGLLRQMRGSDDESDEE